MGKILFLYLKTGGGHLAGARALSEGIQSYFGDRAEGVIINALPENRHLSSFFLTQGYAFSVHYFPWVYAFFYEISRWKPVMIIEQEMTALQCAGHIAETINKEKITKVVSLHFLLTGTVERAFKINGKRLPFINVVMDPFTPHPLWFYKRDMPLIVFSEKVKKEAVEKWGFDKDSVTVIPLFLKKQFDQSLSQKEIQSFMKEQGMNPEKKTILLAGGGDGLPHAEKLIKEIIRMNRDENVAVVSGKNKIQEKEIRKMVKKHQADYIKVYGFVDFMYQLMNTADLVISKGGPATVMETLKLKKPLIIVDYIYGQEKGNVDYVLENSYGFYIPDEKKASEKAFNIVDGKEELNLDHLNIQNGTEEICRKIVDFSNAGGSHA